MNILYYSDKRGRQPVDEWLIHIKKTEAAHFRKVYYHLGILRQNGSLIRARKEKQKGVKKLKKTEIWQLRVNDDRILFFFTDNNEIVLTNQFRKKSNDTPQSEIERAERRRSEWLEQNKDN